MLMIIFKRVSVTRTFLIVIITILPFLLTASGPKPTNQVNPDQPLKNEWDLKAGKVWEIDSAGDTVLASPSPILVSDDGNLYVRDMKNKTHFIFDKNGKFLKSFAPRGEGPGEIIMMDDEEFFIVNDKVIIADYGKINYYKKNGEYIKSASNSIRKRLPHFFLNEEAFIYAPIFKSQMPDRKGNIGKFNLKTGRDKILFQFSLSETEKLDNKPQLIIFPLTPTMVIGYCNERIYYGMSDSYRVNIADLKGSALGSFTLKREKGKVSDEFIIKFLTQMGEPADLAKEWAKSLPRELTFFSHIEEHNNLIYIFKTQWGPGARENQQIDIFSLEGKYLYRAFIKPERDSTISIQHRKSIIIKKDFLYLAFQDKEGETMIAKYAVRLPSAL